jgi:predicted dehydrogenase
MWAVLSPRSPFFTGKLWPHFRDRRDVVYASVHQPGRHAELGVAIAPWNEVLADPRVRQVYVCTPTTTHFPLVMAALAHGKHVLVEKTPATTRADFDAAVALAQARGLKLDIASQAYWHLAPQLLPLRGRIAHGRVFYGIPLHGRHPFPVWDVGFYPLLVLALASEPPWSKVSAHTRRTSTRTREMLRVAQADGADWEMGFALAGRFEQAARLTTHDGKCVRPAGRLFTFAPGHDLYAQSVRHFERDDGDAAVLPLIARMLPLFEHWQAFHERTRPGP